MTEVVSMLLEERFGVVGVCWWWCAGGGVLRPLLLLLGVMKTAVL